MDWKKKLWQFFTDPVIAEFMVKLLMTWNSTGSLLDPAVWPWIFIEKTIDYNNSLDIDVCEIDQKMIGLYKKNINSKTNIHHIDYLSHSLNKKYDYIICNPPYNKFQEIDNRKQILSDFEKKYDIRLNWYTNYCIYFLIKSLNELKNNWKCCYIIPYEFLNAGYWTIVKEYFKKTKTLKAIIKFNNDLNLFDDAITTSCILLFENTKQESVKFISIDNVKEVFEGIDNNLNCLPKTNILEYEQLNPKDKWIKYFDTNQDFDRNNKYKNLIKLSNIWRVKRGIATWKNDYFSLNKSKIKGLNLSKWVCMPCITKAPDVITYKFTKKTFDELYDIDKKVYIFDWENAVSKEDYDYIKYWEQEGYHMTYLTSHRYPRFQIEKKKPSPIRISVFSRNRLKIIRNEIMINNLTTFHSLFVNDEDNEFINILFCYLITPIAQTIIFENKREYGSWLDKFEPNDLNEALILNIQVINSKDKEKILYIYENLDSKWIEALNDIFIKYLI